MREFDALLASRSCCGDIRHFTGQAIYSCGYDYLSIKEEKRNARPEKDESTPTG
ncbi:hypothetical protein KSX_39830 [Ktedonospora formicarum]|uniref:Uncharacterized protein n=1 Tax=Ktedonospora formicarum TaxID=2778364 RepID=A0A8J3MS83_9CHLR|nr:hypothetical protein KSX_39830 [Ktedonospora formicarum]